MAESQRWLLTLGAVVTPQFCCHCYFCFTNFAELTDALGLETAPCEVGQTRAGNGTLQQVALPAAEENGAADLFGEAQASVCYDEVNLLCIHLD